MKNDPTKIACRRSRTGYTVLEMVVASASAVVLMGGLSSALYIGAQSLDVVDGSRAETHTANRILGMIRRDLQEAIEISELSSAPNPLPDPLPNPPIPTSITIKVPDRDGDDMPEIIRYYWSGVPHENLTQEYITYNSVTGVYDDTTLVTLAEDVPLFSLDWLTRLIEGVSTKPFVLFVSAEAPDSVGGITAASLLEQGRIDLIEGWGYNVTVLSQHATPSEFEEQFALANVVYVSGEADGATIGTKLNATANGVVTESFTNAESLGFYDSLIATSTSGSVLSISDPHHYITEMYSIIDLVILGVDKQLKGVAPTAVDAAMIASSDPGNNPPSLLILDAGDELADGSLAPGRRCQLPWGEGSFDATALNSDGQNIMRRSIEWAAGAGDDTATPWILFHEFTEKQLAVNVKNITIDVPPNYAAGDLLIAVVATNGVAATPFSAPAGWNEIFVDTDKFGKVTLGVWWKLASASEPATAQFTWSNKQRAYGWIMRFTGHDPTTPIHATATNDGVSISPTAPALTTMFDDCLLLRIGGYDHDDIFPGDAGMTGHTTITANESNNDNASASGAAAYQRQAYAGNSGTATFSLSESEEYLTVTIAIAPDPNP